MESSRSLNERLRAVVADLRSSGFDAREPWKREAAEALVTVAEAVERGGRPIAIGPLFGLLLRRTLDPDPVLRAQVEELVRVIGGFNTRWAEEWEGELEEGEGEEEPES